MTVDAAVVPGLLLLALELLALACVGYLVARVALRQGDEGMALAQGLVIGPALWGLIVSFVLHLLPGMAGTLAGWIIVVALGAGLAWRAPQALRVPLRSIAGFGLAGAAIFWVALAGRQLLTIPDPEIHLELAAAIRAGAWPPSLPWNPWLPVFYHYGVDLLIGLLAPPFGPDLGLVTELVGAYAWTGLVLVVATLLWRRGWISLLVLTPLLLTAGAWTLIGYIPENILQMPIPTGIPAAGLRASLADIYWPAIKPDELPLTNPVQTSPPNVWKPPFVLAYALTVVVLTWAASSRRRSWPAVLTLAALIGFMGVVEEAIALMTLALWSLLEAWLVLQALHKRSAGPDTMLRLAAGPALAALLLVAGGGVVTGIVAGSFGGAGRLAIEWLADPGSRRPLGHLEVLPGGIGLLGVGPVVAAVAAGLLARRSRLVLALATGSGAFLLASLIMQYEPARDITRLDGHARNFALLALLVALSSRLPALQPRWRYVLGAGFVALVTWPTVAAPMHSIGLGLTYGPRFDNAQPGQPFDSNLMRRYVIRRPMSERVSEYISNSTDTDARVLSPDPTGLSLATGRPNASGFPGHLHLHPTPGAEYVDAIRYLEPTAVRTLDFAYVHATDAWVADLPDRAKRWLADPGFFEPLIRAETDALYRIRPAFLDLEAEPAPASFEALRRAVPASALVYLAPAIHPVDSVRTASVLSHARILGDVHHADLYLLTDIPTEPLGDSMPDFVVASTLLTPSALSPDARRPIWRNDELAVYALHGAGDSVATPSMSLLSVRLSELQERDGRITFTVTFADRAPDQWKGQDWLVVAADESPWAFPRELEADGRRHAGTQWYAGQVIPGQVTTTHRYEFDPQAAELAVRGADGTFGAARSSGPGLDPGVWSLAVRLRGDWWEVAFIPVMRIEVAADGVTTYEVYEGALDSALAP